MLIDSLPELLLQAAPGETDVVHFLRAVQYHGGEPLRERDTDLGRFHTGFQHRTTLGRACVTTTNSRTVHKSQQTHRCAFMKCFSMFEMFRDANNPREEGRGGYMDQGGICDRAAQKQSRGYICSNSQQYIVWVKMLHFSNM